MKYTINELANSKGVSPLVREALLQMEAELDATNRQVEILSDALAESRREVASLKANAALDKKAENARELGLDYEPAPVQEPIGYFTVNDYDKRWRAGTSGKPLYERLAAQPAPVQPVADLDAWNLISRLNSALEAIGDYAHDKSTGPAVPDALWEIRSMAYEAIEDTTPPAAQRQWVGLADEEIEKLRESFATRYAIEAIEAKLRSKNDPM
jgi:hypothetical protein